MTGTRLPPETPLTERQRAVLTAIVNYLDQRGYPPFFSELCTACGFASKNAVFDHLGRLERGGWISRDSATARGLRVLWRPDGTRYAPPGGVRAVGGSPTPGLLLDVLPPVNGYPAQVVPYVRLAERGAA